MCAYILSGDLGTDVVKLESPE